MVDFSGPIEVLQQESVRLGRQYEAQSADLARHMAKMKELSDARERTRAAVDDVMLAIRELSKQHAAPQPGEYTVPLPPTDVSGDISRALKRAEKILTDARAEKMANRPWTTAAAMDQLQAWKDAEIEGAKRDAEAHREESEA
jgi:hypothetical protein